MQQHRGIEPVLGLVVIVDQLLVDPGPFRDLPGAGSRASVRREFRERRLEQPLRGRGRTVGQADWARVSRVNSTRSRPPALARYRAASASWARSPAVAASSG